MYYTIYLICTYFIAFFLDFNIILSSDSFRYISMGLLFHDSFPIGSPCLRRGPDRSFAGPWSSSMFLSMGPPYPAHHFVDKMVSTSGKPWHGMSHGTPVDFNNDVTFQHLSCRDRPLGRDGRIPLHRRGFRGSSGLCSFCLNASLKGTGRVLTVFYNRVAVISYLHNI